MKRFALLILVLMVMTFIFTGCSNNSKSFIPANQLADIYGQVIYPEIEDFPPIIPGPIIGLMNVENNAIGQTIVYLDGEKHTLTDNSGRFVFHDIPVGQHTLKVNCSYLYSEEYNITLTADGITEIELEAKPGIILIYTDYNRNNDSYELYLEPIIFIEDQLVPLSTDKITPLEDPSYTIKVEYRKDGSYVELTNSNVTEIFDLDTEYEVRVSVRENGDLIQQFSRTVNYHQPELKSPNAGITITENNPTFTWEELDGLVMYEFNLYKYNSPNHWNHIWQLENESMLVASEYKLQFRSDYSLENGALYKWNISASLMDEAGHYYALFESDGREFTYSNPTP